VFIEYVQCLSGTSYKNVRTLLHCEGPMVSRSLNIGTKDAYLVAPYNVAPRLNFAVLKSVKYRAVLKSVKYRKV